jgi:DNA-binding MarR family transcriptional regulator
LLDDREVAVWRGLLRVHAHVVAAQNADLERRHDLSVTEWEVLFALHEAAREQRVVDPGREDAGLRIGGIASRVLLTSGGVTRLVDRLESRGLVERTSCPTDRRGTSVRLTEHGRSTLRVTRPRDVLRAELLDRLSDEQKDQLVAAWETALPGSATLDDAAWAARRTSH